MQIISQDDIHISVPYLPGIEPPSSLFLAAEIGQIVMRPLSESEYHVSLISNRMKCAKCFLRLRMTPDTSLSTASPQLGRLVAEFQPSKSRAEYGVYTVGHPLSRDVL